ncbi:hypothetical protein B0T18DRAFT_387306 [Schizothecium vesticola]|uniref:Uncharacterized protein n=1 Tax=Schizothecium vesticola TaxID=314040 RepID=A0AA40KA88_9PEZI|nr:hypothetical protein B0T18DRAFT_387306 [Schizothecium vesticola]
MLQPPIAAYQTFLVQVVLSNDLAPRPDQACALLSSIKAAVLTNTGQPTTPWSKLNRQRVELRFPASKEANGGGLLQVAVTFLFGLGLRIAMTEGRQLEMMGMSIDQDGNPPTEVESILIARLFGREGDSAAQACDMTDEAGGRRGVPVEQQEIAQGQIGLGGVKTVLWSLAPHRSPTSDCREVEAVIRRKMGERASERARDRRACDVATCDVLRTRVENQQQPTRALFGGLVNPAH